MLVRSSNHLSPVENILEISPKGCVDNHGLHVILFLVVGFVKQLFQSCEHRQQISLISIVFSRRQKSLRQILQNPDQLNQNY